MNLLKALFLLVVVGLIGLGAFVYSGAYNVGADDPHSKLVFALVDTLRDESVTAHARDIAVPNLEDPKLVAEGAEHYAAMCTGCHLAPGAKDSEMRAGLYPQPPKLSEQQDLTPAQTFWVIKHGIKMSGMPAWGTTHKDDAIWGLVAFVKKLPQMTPEQYEQMTGNASEHSHHQHENSEDQTDHAHNDSNDHSHDASTDTARGADANVAPQKH